MKKIITTEQLKAARMLLGWDQVALASQASVGVATLRRIEAVAGPLVRGNASVEKIISALQEAGIEFTRSPATGVGVRLSP